MRLTSLCRHPLVAIDQMASLSDAARLLRQEHVGALVVTAQDATGQQHVRGLITDRDLAIEVLARDLPPGNIPVGALVQSEPISVEETASLREAAQAMREAGVRRLLITDEADALVGLLSADDLLEAMAAELSELAQALRSGMLRETHSRSPLLPPQPPNASQAPGVMPSSEAMASGATAPTKRRVVFSPYGTPGMPGTSPS